MRSCSAVTRREVGGQGHIVERPRVEPGVEPPERPGVGPPGVRADGGLDQPARGLCRAADRGPGGVGSGRLILNDKGKQTRP